MVGRCTGRVVRGDCQHSTTTDGTTGLARAAQIYTIFPLALFAGWRGRGLAGVSSWHAYHPGSHRLPASTASRTAAGVPGQYVSLLPGTLSAMLDGQALKVHVLDSGGDYMTELKALEKRVARMCGVVLATSHGGE